MSKTYLYMRGRAKEAQQAKLLEEYPQGETVIDRRPPETLERLIAEAGPGDLIAAVNIYDLPGIRSAAGARACIFSSSRTLIARYSAAALRESPQRQPQRRQFFKGSLI